MYSEAGRKIPGRLKQSVPLDQFIDRLRRATMRNDPAVQILLREILRKFDDEQAATRVSRRSAAISKFHEVEDRMRTVNGRLAPRAIPSKEWVWTGLIHEASQKIARVLPPLTFARITKRAAFGPGATLRNTKERSDLYYKVLHPEVTSQARDLLLASMLDRPGWLDLVWDSGEILPAFGSRVTTVPKDSEKDRTIAIEPSGNMFLQKGIGRVIRTALKRVGVDLDDQSVNQGLAKLGSLYDNLATVDLSAASDSVSYWLVRRLLPYDWFNALEQVRCHRGVLDGRCLKYQKFSSMGNGYTFELESLIFWALAASVIDSMQLSDTRLAVYGDDIILHCDAVPALEGLLTYCGFAFNSEKTFASGPYRESCGKHYWRGRDVTPFYIRKPVDDHETLFLLHNNLRRWFHRQSSFGGYSRMEADGILRWLRGFADPEWSKPRIPDGIGDGAFTGNFGEVLPEPFLKYGWEGFVATILCKRPQSFARRDSAGLLAQLMSYDQHQPWLEHLEPRTVSRIHYGKPLRKVGRTRVVQWNDLNY